MSPLSPVVGRFRGVIFGQQEKLYLYQFLNNWHETCRGSSDCWPKQDGFHITKPNNNNGRNHAENNGSVRSVHQPGGLSVRGGFEAEGGKHTMVPERPGPGGGGADQRAVDKGRLRRTLTRVTLRGWQ